MEIFPAVDVLRGMCVQLVQGERSTATIYGTPLENAERWINAGAKNLHTKEPKALTALADEFGSERIMAGVDARAGEIAVSGWQETAGDYIEWAQLFEQLGAGSLLYTNVDVEGLQAGIAQEPVKALIEAVSIPVVVAGGVSSVADVSALRRLGAAGCVLGSALYSGKIHLNEALKEACKS